MRASLQCNEFSPTHRIPRSNNREKCARSDSPTRFREISIDPNDHRVKDRRSTGHIRASVNYWHTIDSEAPRGEQGEPSATEPTPEFMEF
jgi:hypothetical protein